MSHLTIFCHNLFLVEKFHDCLGNNLLASCFKWYVLLLIVHFPCSSHSTLLIPRRKGKMQKEEEKVKRKKKDKKSRPLFLDKYHANPATSSKNYAYTSHATR